MLQVDASLLRAVAPGQSGARAVHQGLIITEVGASLAGTLDQYEVNTPPRIAHFVAQVAHESDGFCTTEEYASGAAYEGRADLGNTQPGDGMRFKGRGLIQLTGRANYASAAGRLGIGLVADPDLAAVPATSLRIACDFWATKKINTPADRDDIITVTRLVNGGLNGIDSRRAYLAKAKAALAKLQAATLPVSPGAPGTLHRGLDGDDVIRLQTALRDQGIQVAIDGVFGPGTEAAVRQFQADNDLVADGIVGPATWAALG
ncbi:MAG: peptidoglycan-binding protein [Acetobacteraceae bacterium]